MLHSVNDIVCKINESFDALPDNAVVEGIAYTMIRDVAANERIPVILDENTFDGSDQLIPNDDKPAILYHKFTGVTIRRIPAQAVGRGLGPLVNSYNMQLVVFLNKKLFQTTNDQLFLYLQSKLPDNLKIKITDSVEPFKSVLITPTAANLNDLAVWQQEYANAFALKPEHNLFLIQYTIETTFSKDCFSSCLEETVTTS